MDKVEKIRNVVDNLNALGSADAVAGWLAEHDYQGKPKGAMSCPVAKVIRDRSGDHLCVVGGSFALSGTGKSIDFPGTPVHEFVKGFDAGRYPNLIALQ